MKLVELENYSEKRIGITQVGLRLNPGQTRRVHPAVVAHPAVVPYMGNGLRVVPDETAETKVEPIAPAVPAAPATPAPATPPAEDPPAEDPPAEETGAESGEEDGEQGDGPTLRDAYVEAPGITDANVDDIMSAFPTFEELASASKDDLLSLGVAKSYAKKLLEWASSK